MMLTFYLSFTGYQDVREGGLKNIFSFKIKTVTKYTEFIINGILNNKTTPTPTNTWQYWNWLKWKSIPLLAHSTGAVEYTDCISAEG